MTMQITRRQVLKAAASGLAAASCAGILSQSGLWRRSAVGRRLGAALD